MSKKFSLSSLMQSVFYRADNVVFDLVTNSVGIRTAQGITTSKVNEDETISITENAFDSFSVSLPAFAQRIKMSDAKVGDLIVFADRKFGGWIEQVKEKSLSLRKPNGQLSEGYVPPKVANALVEGDLMVVRPLFDGQNGQGLNGVQNNLLPFLLMSDKNGDDSKLDSLMPFFLLSGGIGTQQAQAGGLPLNNPLMLMTMMKDDDSISDILPLLLMSGFGTQQDGGQQNPMMQTIMMSQMLGGDTDAKDLLPLMLMSGAGGAAGGGNMMQTMMMMKLLDKDGADPLDSLFTSNKTSGHGKKDAFTRGKKDTSIFGGQSFTS